MYYKMFTNESKEYMEYADYTFEEHFKGKNLPSYMPRAVMRDYLICKYQAVPKCTFLQKLKKVHILQGLRLT